MASTQPARGTRDFLPDDLRRREYVIARVREVYARYGFEPLETPAFENIETLLGRYGEEGNKLIFKILRRGEHEASGQADLALRYDLTVPFARVVAAHQHTLPKLFRRYQIQPVWRADRPARGRFREFYQCDIDAIGSSSLVVDAEVTAAVSDALLALGFSDFHVRLNDRRLLGAVLERAGVPGTHETDALVALDKLDRVGPEGVRAEFAERGIDPTAASACVEFFGGLDLARPNDVLRQLEHFLGSPAPLETVRTLLTLAESTAAAGRVRIDPSLARGLSYYTGAIMEIAVPDLAGSLGGGGRYDQLIGMFLGRPIPACGFSLGLERIIVVMTERGMFPKGVGGGPADVMVALWNASSEGDALGLARDLRRHGLRVEVYPDPEKPGRQFKYASTRGYRFVALAGEDEQRAGTVTAKDMRTGQQATLPRGEIAAYLRQALARQEKDGE